MVSLKVSDAIDSSNPTGPFEEEINQWIVDHRQEFNSWSINTLRCELNGQHLADISIRIFLKMNFCMLIQIVGFE